MYYYYCYRYFSTAILYFVFKYLVMGRCTALHSRFISLHISFYLSIYTIYLYVCISLHIGYPYMHAYLCFSPALYLNLYMYLFFLIYLYFILLFRMVQILAAYRTGYFHKFANIFWDLVWCYYEIKSVYHKKKDLKLRELL